MGKKIDEKSLLRIIIAALVIVIVGMSIYLIGGQKYSFDSTVNDVIVDPLEKQQKHLKYGFNTDDFEIKNSKVQRNQTLSTILEKYNVGPNVVHKIVKKSKDIFNVRKIRSGRKYSILFSKDSLRVPEYFVYEISAKDYVVFDLHDNVNVYTGEKEVTYKRKTVEGVINSSLYLAMEDAGTSPMLCLEIADIYQWTVDFFGIAKGDSFKILYKQVFIEDKPINDFEILAAVINHDGKDYTAYQYNQGGKLGYFDEKGQSLQKSFLKAPLKFSRISSRFTNRRFHPVLKIFRAHHGVDYAAPTGTPVHSIGDGKIVKKGFQRKGGGRFLTIKHNSVYKTQYMHFSRFAKGMRIGVRVKQGQTIGYVGQSGLATGPHLDYRVLKHGKPINPLRLESPSKNPIKKKNMQAFTKQRELLDIEMNKGLEKIEESKTLEEK